MTQVLRALARIACPALSFEAEAIVGPTDLVPYPGQETYHGRVSELAHHNGQSPVRAGYHFQRRRAPTRC